MFVQLLFVKLPVKLNELEKNHYVNTKKQDNNI